MVKSLRFRLVLNNLIPLLVILPVVGVILAYLLHTQVFLANIANELTRQAVLVADYAAARTDVFNNTRSAEDFLTRISPNVPAKVMLLDVNGRLLISSDPGDAVLVGTLYSVPDVNRLVASNTRAEITIDEGEIKDVVVPVVTPARQLLGYIRLENPLAELYQRSVVLWRVTLFVVGGGLLAGVLLSFVLARELERPLRRTTEAAYQLASGERLEGLPEEGPGEVRTLVQAFNALVERLRTMEESRRRLLANLVHELGTPLGALRSAVQALLGGAKDQPELRDELLAGMNEELILLQRLTEELASLHQQVLGTLELKLQVVDMREWLAQALTPWRQAAAEKNLDWQAHIAEDLPSIEADPERLGQIVGNLFSNAIRYTPAGGKIFVDAECSDGNILIHVGDTGAGVSEEEREIIFQPFKRGQAARRFAEGMGLGLSIARDLARAHGGDIHVAKNTGAGSTFVVTIPCSGSQRVNHAQEAQVDKK